MGKAMGMWVISDRAAAAAAIGFSLEVFELREFLV